MSTVEKKTYDIIGGPDRDGLFDACKYACDKGVKLDPGFKIAILDYPNGQAYSEPKATPIRVSNMKITGIQHGDIAGTSFTLKGKCKADLKETSKDLLGPFKDCQFEAYYDSKRRKGYIAFSLV